MQYVLHIFSQIQKCLQIGTTSLKATFRFYKTLTNCLVNQHNVQNQMVYDRVISRFFAAEDSFNEVSGVISTRVMIK